MDHHRSKPIPISAARDLADQYGYDQIIIYARKCNSGMEHMTTYGVNPAHCSAASKIGDFLKYKIMGWTKENQS
jgi:acetylornithine/succinyldiaminopimelate/putrescine aminotransferase